MSTRSAVVPIRLTPEERDGLLARAREVRLSISEWVRRAALSRRPPPRPAPEVNLKTYQELARVGNNLNQLVRAIHRGEVSGDLSRLPELESLRRLIKEIGLQLIGAEVTPAPVSPDAAAAEPAGPS
jgi:Bacterial mobilisation protein (MobC)